MKQKSVITMLLAFAVFAAHIAAAAPETISYQGYLKESGTAFSGTKSISFSLYDASSGGTQLCTTGAQTLTVTNGLFSYQIGSTGCTLSSINWNNPVYIEVNVNGTALAPREQVSGMQYMGKLDATGGTLTGPLTVQGNITGSGSITVATGTVTASAFVGDGSGITGISAAALNHNTLGNLTTGDPHTQYIKKAGDTMTGGLAIGFNTATSSLQVTNTGGGQAIAASGTVTVGSNTGSDGYDINIYGIYGALTGGRLFWDASKDALRTGIDTDGAHWNDANTGAYSFAAGRDTKASALHSVAMGYITAASGDAAVSLGYNTISSNTGSTAMGLATTASGYGSTAIGYGTTASGLNSTSMGDGTIASGDISIAMGQNVTAAANNTVTIGLGSASRLVNNTASSLMVGFNSDLATLFVGSASGAGTYGKVGIAKSNPSTALDVNGTVTATAFDGDGSLLTNIVASGAVAKTGDTMTGSLSLSATTATNSLAVINPGTGSAIYGQTSAGSPNAGVWGYTSGTSGMGVRGTNAGGSGYGVYGESTGSGAAILAFNNASGDLFSGNVTGTGNLLKLQKSGVDALVVDNIGTVTFSRPSGNGQIVLKATGGNGQSAFTFKNSAGTSLWTLYNDILAVGAQTIALKDMVAGSDRLTIDASGNVMTYSLLVPPSGYVSGALLDLGDVTVDYPANAGWSTTWNSNILLSGLDSTSITFHDYSNNYSSIRYRDNNFYLGENVGWGTANLNVYGDTNFNTTSSNPLTITSNQNGASFMTFVNSGAGLANSYLSFKNLNSASVSTLSGQLAASFANNSSGNETSNMWFNTMDAGGWGTTMTITGRKVGIGMIPSGGELLQVNGTAANSTGAWAVVSDKRLKKNVLPLDNALETMSKLHGVSFEWIAPEKHGNYTGRRMGVLAQEVEEVVPEWVIDNGDGYKAFQPMGFDALTIEAIKELKKQNEEMKATIEELKAEIDELKKTSGAAGGK